MSDEYVNAVAAEIKKQIKPGDKIVIETSNETLHLDPETGALVSDSYIEERTEINIPVNPPRIWVDGGGNVG